MLYSPLYTSTGRIDCQETRAEDIRSEPYAAGVTNRTASGEEGELWVRQHVRCPNCAKGWFERYPSGYPLYDVYCLRCQFRAQVRKHYLPASRSRHVGASWEKIGASLTVGEPLPPIIYCHGWPSGAADPEEVFLYPFVPYSVVKARAIKTGPQTGRNMTDYVGLRDVPRMLLWRAGQPKLRRP